MVPALVRAVLESLDDLQWLDEGKSWFHLESGSQYGLPNMMDKVFSICPRIDVSRLRSALERHRRNGRKIPPGRVLLAFCRQRPGIAVEGRTIVAETPPSPEDMLSGVEAVMVRVLRKYGPVLERGTFEEYCLAEGMNRFSFNASLMALPGYRAVRAERLWIGGNERQPEKGPFFHGKTLCELHNPACCERTGPWQTGVFTSPTSCRKRQSPAA